MNFGYLLIVAEHESVDYLQLAYGLALSIKNTQREGYDRVAIVIDDKTKKMLIVIHGELEFLKEKISKFSTSEKDKLRS